jgi:hypothetical protein
LAASVKKELPLKSGFHQTVRMEAAPAVQVSHRLPDKLFVTFIYSARC